MKNGRLLALAAAEFDCLVTVDKNLSFQQNLAELPLPIIVLHSRSSKVKHLAPLMAEVGLILRAQLSKTVFNVGPSGMNRL